MRSKAVFIVSIFFASLLGGLVEAQTPEDIAVDGSYSDWSADSLMASNSDGIDLRLTWNETMLFIGWDGTDWKSSADGADLFDYLNTSVVSVLARDWGLHTPFRSLPTTGSFWKTTPTTNTSPSTAAHGLTSPPVNSTQGGPTTGQRNCCRGAPWLPSSFEIMVYARAG